MRQHIRIVAFAALLAAVSIGPSAPAHAETLEAQVNQAIERGVTWLSSLQKPDGHFHSQYHKKFPMGVTALNVYTLVKSGVQHDDPRIKKAVEYLRYLPFEKTYSVSTLGKEPTKEGWRSFSVDLAAYAGKEVVILIRASAGGKSRWKHEAICIDRMTIKAR